MRSIAIIIATWGVVVAAGFAALWQYSLTAGTYGAGTTAEWPARSKIVREKERATLVVFVHPFCPCSRSSLNELQILASRCRQRVGIRIVFTVPVGREVDWETCELVKLAKQVPQAVVVADIARDEQRIFRATTSGEALLFGEDGRLLFHGGITSARGHEGESLGRTSLTAWIEGRRADVDHTPVFGCAL